MSRKTAVYVLQQTADLYLKYNRSLKKAAPHSGVTYQTFNSRVRKAMQEGFIQPEEKEETVLKEAPTDFSE